MKKQSLNFLILVLFCSYLTYSVCSNLKVDAKKEVKEITSEATKIVPDFKPTPRTTLLETVAHEDINFGDKMFYAKFNLKDKLYQYRSHTSGVINGRLLETQIHIPINLAKLDIELYVQHIGNYRSSIDMNYPWEETYELYFDDTLIGEQTWNFNTVIAVSSLYLQGSVFHVPAGTYKAYLRMKVMNKNLNYIGFTDWHWVTNLTNGEWTPYLIHEWGYFEFAGIGGN